VTGVGRTDAGLGATLGITLGALAGLPPSPLFASEILIVAGGFQAGRPWEAFAAAFLLALGFLGVAHALLETTIGKAPRRGRVSLARSLPAVALVVAATVTLLVLTGVAAWLPASDLVTALQRGVP
jgi:hydrogenase-4 component F